MEVARIIVCENLAHISELKTVTAGLSNATIYVEYAAGAWDNLSKTAVFKGAETKDVLNAESVVEIPAETIREANKHLQVGFYGSNQDGTVIPTIWADLGRILPAADPSGDISTDPVLPVWAQLQSRVEELAKDLENISQGGSPGTGTRITINGEGPDKNGNFIINTLNDVEIAQLDASLIGGTK